jgi:hypothetical protein
MEIYEKYDDPSAYEQAMQDNLILAVQTRADQARKPEPKATTEVTSPGDEGTQDLTGSDTYQVQGSIDGGQAAATDGSYGQPEDWASNKITDVSVTGFNDYLSGAGYENDPDIPSVDYGKPPERSSYTGSDWVFDPSTGEKYTHGQWKAIKTDPAARADYLLNKQVGPIAQDLLNLGIFNQQPILDARGNPTGKYEESNDPTLLPVSNLQGAITSPVVSNPWESSSFDYSPGLGRMEWIGLGTLTQRRYIDQMHKIVSERLGHSSVMLTMDTYSHVLPTMQDGPAERLEELLFG